jgi:drug/metabolite transporter (DMT)-like permease
MKNISMPVSIAHSRFIAKGPAFMLSSAFFFAILGLLIKLLSPSFSVWDIAMYRFGGGALILLALFGWRANFVLHGNYKLMTARGISGSMAFILIIVSIRQIPLSTAMVIFYCFPAFAAIFSPLLFGDRISKLDVVCIAVALIGVGILFDFKITVSFWGQMLALVASIFAGLTISLIKKLRENHGSVTIYFYFCIIGTAICFGPYIRQPYVPQYTLEWLLLGGILVLSVIAQLLVHQGLRYCKSWEGGVIMMSELIFTTIFGILLLSESVNWRFWTGGSLIILSALALNLYSKRNRTRRSIQND